MSNRRWFRFHLSTGVLAMLAAAAMLYMNVRIHWSWYEFSASGRHWTTSWKSERGWPFYFYNAGYTVDDYDGLGEGRMESKYSETNPPLFNINGVENYREWTTNALLLDFGVAMIAIVGIAFLSESIIRRREARKP